VKLPTYQQLTKAQEQVVNLPIGESCLVTGPPGTGKTVVALHRTHLASKSDAKHTHMLMLNNILMQYTSLAAKSLKIDTQVTTFHQFMYYKLPKSTGFKTPALGPYEFDWDTILKRLGDVRKDHDLHFIIDEAQDLRKEFFLLATRLAAKLTIMADENQCMALNSRILDIQNWAAIPKNRTFNLTVNYRNSRPIAEFASQFYVGLATGIPEFPSRTGPQPRVERHDTTDTIAKSIERYYKNNDDQTIGVICMNKKTQNALVHRLEKVLPKDKLQTYARMDGKAAPKIDFSKAGVYIVNLASCKGLEFDAVYLPDIENLTLEDDDTRVKMKLYVACSRAVHRLTIAFQGEAPEALSLFNRNQGEWAIDQNAI